MASAKVTLRKGPYRTTALILLVSAIGGVAFWWWVFTLLAGLF
jgi:cytoskeletal protein RodZ